jgi:dephospho-CoA kinase
MQPSNRPLIIGITGNIGSGKSSFCRYLECFGKSVIYTDKLANKHLDDEAVISELVLKYGDSIIVKDTARPGINKATLADIVFNDKQNRLHLNSLLHPLVLADMQALVVKSSSKVLVFEVPLLFEANLSECFDFIVLITAPPDLRVQRIIERGLTPSEARARIDSQMDDSYKITKSDIVVENCYDITLLEQEAKHLINLFSTIAHRNIRQFI